MWRDHAGQDGFKHLLVFSKCIMLVRVESECLSSGNLSLLYTRKFSLSVKNTCTHSTVHEDALSIMNLIAIIL